MILQAQDIPTRGTRPGEVGKEPELATKALSSEWSHAKGNVVLPHKQDNESYGDLTKYGLFLRLNDEDDQVLRNCDLFPQTRYGAFLRGLEDMVVVYASSQAGV